MTLLTYHRVGGGSGDELDLASHDFALQLDVLVCGDHDVVPLDAAIHRLQDRDARSALVLTFDDGFAEVYGHAFPLLRERELPFTLYLAAGLVGGAMAWEGSAARSQGAAALTWEQIGEMVDSGLCTVANHTNIHASPSDLDVEEIDACSDAIERALGHRPRHFAWTWGVPVPRLLPAVRDRFTSAATGVIGRNAPGDDLHALKRVPVRASDPLPFFRAKLTGDLWAERTYERIARGAKEGAKVLRRG